MDALQHKLAEIFFNHALRRRDAMKERRYVHYTSSAVAVSILQKKEVWMRNALTMNDFSEIQHGCECIRHAYQSPLGKRLQSVLNGIHPGFTGRVEKLYDGWQPNFKNATYMTCFSEHKDEENRLGRLSMWRAYGANNGVALVLKGEVFALETQALAAYSSPVLYATKESFLTEFEDIVQRTEKNVEVLRQIPEVTLQNAVFNMFRIAALCTKHLGFAEELEWRVHHQPDIEPSTIIHRQVEVVRGVPQLVYKIPLINHADKGLTGLEISQFLDHVIIGPTEHPKPIYDAFVALLEEAKVEHATDKVWISQIPLRQF